MIVCCGIRTRDPLARPLRGPPAALYQVWQGVFVSGVMDVA